MKITLLLLFNYLFLNSFTSCFAQRLSIFTQHNNNLRTGANLQEQELQVTNVQPDSFGKLFTLPAKGLAYAQPLYWDSVAVPGKGLHNVVYLATMQNDVIAYDADDPRGINLWATHLGDPVAVKDTHFLPTDYKDTVGSIGIVSTPVLDTATATLYIVSLNQLGIGIYSHYLHALDATTGAERPNSPKPLQASVPGTGDGSLLGVVPLLTKRQLQRAGLLLTKGVIYICFASYGDTDPYHGWVLAYDASSLGQLGAYCNTAYGNRGGIWHGGGGPAADEQGNVFVAAGNGSSDTTQHSLALGSSIIKLQLGDQDLHVVDYFTPPDADFLTTVDFDLGNTGPMLLPGTNYVVAGHKAGGIYVLNKSKPWAAQQQNQASFLQSFTGFNAYNFGSPVYWKGPDAAYLYYWGSADRMKAFKVVSTGLKEVADLEGDLSLNDIFYNGGFLSLSAKDSTAGTGIVWATTGAPGDTNSHRTGILYAYDASKLGKALYTSEQLPERDRLGAFAKFNNAIVATGKVYVPTFSDQLVVYGLLGKLKPHLLNFKALGTANAIELSWQASSSGLAKDFLVERSLDSLHFTQLGTLAGKPGSSVELVPYSFKDGELPPGVRKAYYRISMSNVVDTTLQYSTLRVNTSPTLTVYPNPVVSPQQLTLALSEPTLTASEVSLINSQGELVVKYSWPVGQQQLQFPLQGVVPGIYILNWRSSTGLVHKAKVIIH